LHLQIKLVVSLTLPEMQDHEKATAIN